MIGELDLNQHRIEEYLDSLFEVVFLADDGHGTWDGLPHHLAATYDHDDTTESVRVVNWKTKDEVLVRRPRAGTPTVDWVPELAEDLERPLYKVQRTDLLRRACGLVLANGCEVTTYEMRYEISPGTVRFRADDFLQRVPVIDRAVHGQDNYPTIGDTIIMPLEPQHMLVMPDFTVDGLMPQG